MRPMLILFFWLSALIGTTGSQERSGDPPTRLSSVAGASIFQHHCVACHGADGRGRGSSSIARTHSVPDLTLISRRNGGKFPYRRVREVIEGKQAAPSSGRDQEMPSWGPVFHQVESDQDWGEVRLEAVTRHVESMQQK
jgi:mono/diheme cytochrome c family protein